jgi:hypothetical protein
MADLRISELNSLSGVDLAGGDLLPLVDVSASETKKIAVSGFTQYGIALLPSGTIAGSKITFSGGEVTSVALASGAVGTAAIANDAITAAKIADETIVDLVTSLPGSGGYAGQFALLTTNNKASIWDGSSWVSFKAAGSINTISGDSSGVLNITATTSGDTVTLVPSLDNTSAAAQFLAGPTANSGSPSYRIIAGDDLPSPTTSAKGGVSINGEGLRVDGTQLEIDNDVSASASYVLVTHTSKGLVNASRAIISSDLPAATVSTKGAVLPGTGLEVDGSGTLDHSNTATPGTYTKVTIDAQGHITTGDVLADSDLPNHSAALLTAGTLDVARIGTNAITGTKLANYAVSKFGETQPVADHIGQFFFNPLSRDLFLWDGNVFQPIGISVGEIVFAGTYDASANLVGSVTSEGTAIGLTAGGALPAASAVNNRYYLVVSEAGTGTSPAPTESLNPPDIILSNGSNWTLIDVSDTITAQVANNVSFTPYGRISATNVQAAIQELDDEKLSVASGTMNGPITMGYQSSGIFFEGSTDNGFETRIDVVDPTADRTILFPNLSGTVITTGDTATISGVMIASGTITNTNISPTAAIEGTKIQAATTTQSGVVVLTNSVSSTSTTTAATPSGVKTAYDLAAAALPASGGTMTGTITFASGQTINGYLPASGGTMTGAITFASGQTISGYAQLAAAQSFTAGQRGAVVTIAGSGTVTIDLALGNNFAATLSGNVTLATPSGMVAGQTGSITLTQDGTGSRLVSYSGWKFPGGSAPTATTTASGTDIIAYYVESATRISARMINDVK